MYLTPRRRDAAVLIARLFRVGSLIYYKRREDTGCFLAWINARQPWGVPYEWTYFAVSPIEAVPPYLAPLSRD